jgi:hypothetical protein
MELDVNDIALLPINSVGRYTPFLQLQGLLSLL